ncbi:nucleotidyltransferase domain-containing protein [Lysinibacillus fusiformis]|uniref:nucleotidyltransferase domain-containing protein n=1 Tax=Lysinibacillus fusiformis TaxID=28031 RepID=UPI00215A345B|nr:nucleotidyltransferase domain-containing protein [Lysinibacillus fusiformis]MCR8852855.1 nucleotidyltransferase domain-containing protein [Lysinibacillus fusiformis]
MMKFSINRTYYEINEYNNYIEAICLFGSNARGDHDSLSDIDIFFLISDCDEKTYVTLKKSLESQLNLPAHWLSIYRISTVKEMKKKGSYFLWHLKKEGIILYSRQNILNEMLNTLPKYKDIKQDLNDYLTICNDIKKSIVQGDSPVQYELAVLASLVRNTCIAISHQHGKFVFNREKPIWVVKDIVGPSFPFSIEEYRELYKFRIAHTRGINSGLKEISQSYIENWIRNVEFIINFGIQYSGEGDTNDFQ